MKKHATAQLIFAAITLAAQQAWALGFGRTVSNAVLGQSLTFTVPVHLAPGERFGGDCVSAEVRYGEAMLSPNVVRTAVEPGADDENWIVRVTASTAITEPIVEVTLSAGCTRAFARRFTVFADPPAVATAVASPTAVAGDPGGVRRATAVAAASAAGRELPPVVRAPQARAGAAAASPARPRARRKGAEQPAAAARAGGHARADAAHARPAADAGARLVLEAGVSRLKLDMEDPVIPLSSGPAASAPVDRDDGEANRFKALEQGIQAVRRDGAAARERAAALQAQLVQAQARGDWLPWMAGLLGLAVAAIAGLAWRLRQQSRQAHRAWFEESQLDGKPAGGRTPGPSADAAQAPSAPAASRPERVPEPGPASAPAPALAPPMAPEPAAIPADFAESKLVEVAATRPLDRPAVAGAAAPHGLPRELSVEELLDLEQQADFFIALGQEDAAVDLLMSHLRSAGGQSPLPYTKLLEIYRRQGDRSAYERIRARFNRRFNAYAPDWETGPASGRVLEDYPATVALLENAWRSPLDAMALLEGLLFKRDDRSELFDLPAYRDILLLYSLARDSWQNGGGSAGIQVDVLLPLDDPYGLDAVDTMPYPGAGAELAAAAGSGLPDSDRLTAFHMSDFEAGGVELDLPAIGSGGPARLEADAGDEVHAMLGELSLEPIHATAARPAPRDWDDGVAAPGGPDTPAER